MGLTDLLLCRHKVSNFCLLLALYLCFNAPILRAGDLESLVEKEWVYVESPRFRVFSDAGKRSTQSIAFDLESFSSVLPSFINTPLKEDISKLVVFALEDSSNLRRLINFGNASGLFITNGIDNYAVADLKRYSSNQKKQNAARQTLFHEYVHFYTANLVSNAQYPMWYSEGMADFLSTILIHKKSVKYGLMHEGRVRSISRSKTVPIEKLFEATEYPEDHREKDDFYHYAWLVVHFLYANSDYSDMNGEFLGRYNEGVPVKDAFEASFGLTYEQFGKIVGSHLRKQYTAWEIKLAEPLNLEIQGARKVPSSEIAYELGRLMLDRSAPSEEETEANNGLGYELMEYAIAKEPENLAARLALWNRALENQKYKAIPDYEALGQRITKLLEANPRNSMVARYFGDWLTAQVKTAKAGYDFSRAEKFAEQARGKYRRALALDAINKHAFVALGRLYGLYPDYLLQNERDFGEYEAVLRELIYMTSWLDYRYALAIFLENRNQNEQAIVEYRLLAQGSDRRLARLARSRLKALRD